MRFYRLVAPLWSFDKLRNGKVNPKFKKAIPGPSILEGIDFPLKFLQKKNQQGYSIYYFPNHPSRNVYDDDETSFLNGRLIDSFNCVFADLDFKDGVYASVDDVIKKVRELSLLPSYVVESGNGVHVYFKISDLTRSAYVIIQLQLIKFFDSDPSVFTVLQLMRLPGFKNTKKYEDYKDCKILKAESSNNVYTVKQIIKILPSISQEQKDKAKLHINRLEGRISLSFSHKDVNIDDLPDRFIELMIQRPRLAELFDSPEVKGDRSSADMTLCHFLYTAGFSFNEAVSIMGNTQKALEKGTNRMVYATLTAEKCFVKRKVNNFETVSEFLISRGSKILEQQVYGSVYLDTNVLGCPWRRKELLGVISGPGVGKTALALNIIYDSIRNNLNDTIYLFFTLEMTKGQIAERWINLVGEDFIHKDRLYIVDTTTISGDECQLGLQEIYDTVIEVEQHTGKKVNSIVIDHFHLVSSHIDVRRKPYFSIQSEQGTGYGNIRNLSKGNLCSELKTLVKLLNVFGIILTQTTKNQGLGYTPIQKSGCYGISQYENIMDRIITVYQPLYLIQKEVDVCVTAFQYVKIREKHKRDKIWEQDPKVLTFDIMTGALRGMTPEEYQSFVNYLPIAKEARINMEKGEVLEFTTI